MRVSNVEAELVYGGARIYGDGVVLAAVEVSRRGAAG